MIRIKRGAERPLRVIDLGRGVTLYARALDTVTQARVLAAVEAEFAAIEDGAPLRDWGAIPARLADGASERELMMIKMGWMWGVLLAERAVERIEGVIDDATGAPAEPGFDLFTLLFSDLSFESAWRVGARELDKLWDAEKNVSGRGPNGDLAAAMNSAPVAATSIPPAPEASPSPTSTEQDAAAPSSNAPPAPAPAPSLGA